MFARTNHPDHARHDLLLVAAHGDPDVGTVERIRLQRQLEDCEPCRLLARDVQVLRAATARLPAPPRPRDFRITGAEAARARSWWQRFRSVVGSRQSPFVPRLATSLTALGIAGMLLASAPGLLPIVAGPATGDARPGAEWLWGGQTKDTSGQPGAPGGTPAPEVPTGGSLEPAAGGGQGSGTDTPRDGGTVTPPGTTRSGESVDALVRAAPATMVLSGWLLMAGLGLFALRWGVRRFG